MSDQSNGPGWWMASDGKWYPPEQHANRAATAPLATVQRSATAQPSMAAQSPAVPVPASTVGFTFDGGAGTYIGTGLLALLVTILSLGVAYPFALVLRQRWIAKHTHINGVRLKFTGTGVGLFGNWIKWLLLTLVTIGIYLLWVMPRVRRWIVVHTEFDRNSPQPDTFLIAGVPYRRAA